MFFLLVAIVIVLLLLGPVNTANLFQYVGSWFVDFFKALG